MGSTEIVVMCPIRPAHKFHSPSPPQSRTSLKEVAQHQQQTYRRYPHREAPHLSRRHRWLRCHLCLRRCRRYGELGVEPPVEEMVTVGFLGLYLGIFGDPVFFIFPSFFYLPYIYPCTETNSNSIATSHKKSCNPTSQVHGFAHEAPPVQFRTDQHVVSLLSCGAVTDHNFQYFDNPMQVNTHCECSTRL